MADLKWKAKDPSDIADYVVNWKPAKPFLPTSVTVTNSVAVIGPQDAAGPGFDELAIVDQSNDDSRSIIRFSGGTNQVSYSVDVDIDVSTGEHFNTTIVLPVLERIKK